MADPDVERINNAVNACLKHCYEAPSPLPRLAEFLQGLRTETDWLDEEIRAIEIAVLRMLKDILVEEGGDDDGALGSTSLIDN